MGEKDDLQLKDIEKNADVDTTEKSPLKEPEVQENADETKEPIENGIKEVKSHGHLVQQLNDPKIRLVIAVVAGVLLLLVAGGATVALLIFGSQMQNEPWIEDTTPRLLRLVPTPNGAKNLIKFRAGHGEEGRIWPNLTDEITNLYTVYDKSSKRNVTNCGGRATPPVDQRYTCFFDISDIAKECNKETNFGYATGSPCIFIQFNQVANFTPEVFTRDDLQNESLPKNLRENYSFRGPWVDCQPNDIPDTENAGPFKVLGSELPPYSFPYTGHPEYMAPLVALKLDKPSRAVTIGFTCRLWARNVVYNQTTSGLNDTMVDEAFVPSAILPFNILIE